MAHGGPDCRLGAYAGLGFPAQAAREPGIPDIAVHLLLGVEGIHAPAEDSDPPAEPREGKKYGFGNARQGDAGGRRKSRDAEAGCTAGSETGRGSTRSQPDSRSDHAVGSALSHGAHQCAAEWTELSRGASAGRDRTNQGTDQITASRNRCTARGRAWSRKRPHPAGSGSAECSCTSAFVDGNVASTRKSRDGERVRGSAATIIGVARLARRRAARIDSRWRGCTSPSIN